MPKEGAQYQAIMMECAKCKAILKEGGKCQATMMEGAKYRDTIMSPRPDCNNQFATLGARVVKMFCEE